MTLGLAMFLDIAGRNNYRVFDAAHNILNLNIVGWRTKNGRPDHFDDMLALYWPTGFKNQWHERMWPVTTRPGTPWLKVPMNPKGTASLVPGQYVNAYSLGEYKGYTALRQVGPVKVYRDNNRDSQLDENTATIEEGLFGIHIHRAGVWSKLVGVSSAGCQVFQKRLDFEEFIDLCTRSSKIWGNSFTYTLVEF